MIRSIFSATFVLALLIIVLFSEAAFAQVSARDFNGDGNEEFILYNPNTSTFTAIAANGNVIASTQCGLPGDVPLFGNWGTALGFGSRTRPIVWRRSAGSASTFFACDDDGSILPELVTIFPNTGGGIAFGQTGDIPITDADFNGDGNTDPSVWRPRTGDWLKIIIGFGAVTTNLGQMGDVPVAADYDGDGNTDEAVFRPISATWIVRRSTTNSNIERQWGLPGDIPVPGDYDGDGKDDFATWRPDSGQWSIRTATGVEFLINLGLPGDVPIPADLNGDNRTDTAVYRPRTGEIFYIQSGSVQTLVTNIINAQIPHQTRSKRAINDFDGDGRSDLAVVREFAGSLLWYAEDVERFTLLATGFGLSGDHAFARDFTGNGQADLGIVREFGNNAFWYIRPANGDPVIGLVFGTGADYVVPGDYDGDKRADVAIAREDATTGAITWNILRSSNGQTVTQDWGLIGDEPVQGDFDGDGVIDPTVTRASAGLLYWFSFTYDPFSMSSESTTVLDVVQWGIAGDIPAPIDFDGDGRTDHAVIRDFAGQLFLFVRLAGGTALAPIPWGLSGDTSIPGNYRGSLSTQAAVWRPSGTAAYYINNFPAPAQTLAWGLDGDTALSPYPLGRVPGDPTPPDPVQALCDVTRPSGDGAGSYVHKPISEGDGNLVVLLPATDAGVTAMTLYDSSGNRLESTRFTGNTNGGRPTFRASRPGSGYAAGLIEQFSKAGQNICYRITDPGTRYD